MKVRTIAQYAEATQYVADGRGDYPVIAGVNAPPRTHPGAFRTHTETLAGLVHVNVGDWIVDAPEGRRVMQDLDFRAAYEPVPDVNKPPDFFEALTVPESTEDE